MTACLLPVSPRMEELTLWSEKYFVLHQSWIHTGKISWSTATVLTITSPKEQSCKGIHSLVMMTHTHQILLYCTSHDKVGTCYNMLPLHSLRLLETWVLTVPRTTNFRRKANWRSSIAERGKQTCEKHYLTSNFDSIHHVDKSSLYQQATATGDQSLFPSECFSLGINTVPYNFLRMFHYYPLKEAWEKLA